VKGDIIKLVPSNMEKDKESRLTYLFAALEHHRESAGKCQGQIRALVEIREFHDDLAVKIKMQIASIMKNY
jgi:hypothetical protein